MLRSPAEKFMWSEPHEQIQPPAGRVAFSKRYVLPAGPVRCMTQHLKVQLVGAEEGVERAPRALFRSGSGTCGPERIPPDSLGTADLGSACPIPRGRPSLDLAGTYAPSGRRQSAANVARRAGTAWAHGGGRAPDIERFPGARRIRRPAPPPPGGGAPSKPSSFTAPGSRSSTRRTPASSPAATKFVSMQALGGGAREGGRGTGCCGASGNSGAPNSELSSAKGRVIARTGDPTVFRNSDIFGVTDIIDVRGRASLGMPWRNALLAFWSLCWRTTRG